MVLIDSLTVCGEKTDMKGESDYFQLVRSQLLTNQNEFNIYNRRRVSAENAKKPHPHWILHSRDTIFEVSIRWWKTWNGLCTDTEINHLHSFTRLEMKAYCFQSKLHKWSLLLIEMIYYRMSSTPRLYLLWFFRSLKSITWDPNLEAIFL